MYYSVVLHDVKIIMIPVTPPSSKNVFSDTDRLDIPLQQRITPVCYLLLGGPARVLVRFGGRLVGIYNYM